jgi:HAD superfamily hydrolase (TIGR01509 family)
MEFIMNILGKEISAAIFDMDGTMFDTERLRMAMLKQASQDLYGQSMSDELLIHSLGLSAVRAENLAKQEYGDDYPYAEIRKLADEHEIAYVRQHGVPIKRSLIDILERFKKNEVLLAVATSSRREIAEYYLTNANVIKYFDVIVCGDEVENGKPDPEIFLKAAAKINCNPQECLIFEDSENGLLAAIGSGALPVYIKDIKEPPAAIIEKCFFACNEMSTFLGELIKVTPKYPLPHLNERFPQGYNQITVGIHGFGAIGGGYLTQIFSHWDGYSRPREIIGVTGNALLRNIVNAFDKFTVNYESIAYEQTIKNVRLIDIDDEEKVTDMYKRAAIVALCLPELAIKQQAKLIASSLKERAEHTSNPLTILIVINKVSAAKYVKKQVLDALKEIASPEQVKEIINNTFFCETVVNRMVSRMSKTALLKQIQSKIKTIELQANYEGVGREEHFSSNSALGSTITMPVAIESGTHPIISLKHITKILGNISDIQSRFSNLNIVLFNSEPDMALYVSSNSPILHRLRQIKVVDDIASLQMIKNRLSNGTHAVIAWYSSLLGYKTIGQGMGDERVLCLVTQIMENEIKPILAHENPELSDYINDFIPAFIKRCRLSFKDSCHRVGRDPIRKLQRNERILGTISMARKYDIPTPWLEFGLVTGLVYAITPMDPDDEESLLLKKIYDETSSITDVMTYHGKTNGKKCEFLNKESDAAMLGRISDYFNLYQENKEEFYNLPMIHQPAN